MKEQKELPKTIKIGDCELDVPSGTLVDGHRSTKLVPISVDVLIYLAEHSEQLVTRDQLMESVWPSKFVTESQLSKRITEIRQALGDDQKPHRYIETLPKRGYRLICQCEIVAERGAVENADSIETGDSAVINGETVESSAARQRMSPPPVAGFANTRPLRSVAMATVVIALGYFVYVAQTTEGTVLSECQISGDIADKSVAVLPFRYLSPNNDEEWLSDGLAVALINSLGQLPELSVRDQTSSFQFRNEDLGIPEIATKLCVSHVVEGSVRTDGDQLLITATLIRGEDGFQIWSEDYDDSREAILDLQEDVAESIATELDVYLDDERRELMFQIGTRNAGAYEAYLQGWDIWNYNHGGRRFLPRPDDPKLWEANEYFKIAMELDPDFAAAALLHSDAFIHVVMNGIDGGQLSGDSNPMYSAEEAMDLAMEDMNRAIMNAHSPAMSLGIQLQRDYFSDDWSHIPGLLVSFREQIYSYPWRNTDDGWLIGMLDFFGEQEMSRKLAEVSIRADRLTPPSSIERRRLSNLVDERRRAAIEGNREETTRILELRNEGNNIPPWYQAYLAAVLGDYAEANRVAIEETSGTLDGLDTTWLTIFHETENKIQSRELTQRIDKMPGGPAMFVTEMRKYEWKLNFDMNDAPQFAAQLRQVGIDPDLFATLPRLSKVGETSD